MKLRPLGDRVLVKPMEDEDRTKSGIVLPDTAKEKPQRGEVVAVGPGEWDEEGEKRMPLDVKVTLGPKGRNVVLEKKFGSPIITHDGVTVAREIELEDPFENAGAQLVREVATKTEDVAGDGTTTATVLAQSLIREGLKMVAAGANPMALKRGIDRAVAVAVEEIRKIAKPVETKDAMQSEARISANGPTAGSLIADAMDKVGKDGVITVEESKGIETTVEVVEGT